MSSSTSTSASNQFSDPEFEFDNFAQAFENSSETPSSSSTTTTTTAKTSTATSLSDEVANLFDSNNAKRNSLQSSAKSKRNSSSSSKSQQNQQSQDLGSDIGSALDDFLEITPAEKNANNSGSNSFQSILDSFNVEQKWMEPTVGQLNKKWTKRCLHDELIV